MVTFTEEVLNINLFSANREVLYKYYLLDKKNNVIRELNNVESGSINYDINSEIKRTAKFHIIEDSFVNYSTITLYNDIDKLKDLTLFLNPNHTLEDLSCDVPQYSSPKFSEIDYLSNRIMPTMVIKEREGNFENKANELPNNESNVFYKPTQISTDYVAGKIGDGYVYREYPLGVFILSSPTRYEDRGYIKRDVEAYDLSILLRDYRLPKRLTVNAGEPFLAAVEGIIKEAGIDYVDIEPNLRRANRVLEYEAGTSALTVVNDLLAQIGYIPINFTSKGVAISFPYVDVERRKPTHEYTDNIDGVVLIGASDELDLSKAYNSFTVVRSNEDEKPIVGRYVNTDPNDPLSTVNLGREISYFEKVEDISDEGSLDRYVRMVATEHAIKLGGISFKTPNMPTHCCYNVILFKYRNLDIEGIFLETSWSMDLKIGGEMNHTLQSTHVYRKEVL